MASSSEQLEVGFVYARKSKDVQRKLLLQKYSSRLVTNAELNRSLVSFQGNKSQPFYRWLKYKEAYSEEFIQYVLEKFCPRTEDQTVLDPFAGIGTTLTVAASKNWKAIGIELLPIGLTALKARVLARNSAVANSFKETAKLVDYLNFDDSEIDKSYFFKHIPITSQAFSAANELQIANFSKFISSIKNEDVRLLFQVAGLSVLEEVSFTRKDGQYLRWDYRSERKLTSSFNKGHISTFKDAIKSKLHKMREDVESHSSPLEGYIDMIEGSCLNEMRKLPDNSINLVLTSPPYCNRYDYTRTYALELAYLGISESQIKELRQALLSATVENKSKLHQLQNRYVRTGNLDFFLGAVETFKNQSALNEVLSQLRGNRDKLNNRNIPEMVENYFFEMNLLIKEFSRVLRPGGKVVMVNDNVQYHGEEVPVDLLLANMAEDSGLSVDAIWVLARGKGNSSQQMGEHGRNELRKCIYVWGKQP